MFFSFCYVFVHLWRLLSVGFYIFFLFIIKQKNYKDLQYFWILTIFWDQPLSFTPPFDSHKEKKFKKKTINNFEKKYRQMEKIKCYFSI